MPRKKRILLLFFGLLCLAAAAALQYRNFCGSLRAGQAAQLLLDDLKTAISKPESPPPRRSTDTPDAESAFPESEFAGILSIPSLGLELPVYAEYSRDALSRAPCRQCGSAADGNLVIAGHNFRRHFGPLSRLRKGDALQFTETDGCVYSYTVAAVSTLSPTQAHLVFESAHSLVLYTCNYSGRARLCVFCDSTAPAD